jgi:4-hydroxy-tetrahydrodipicolinate reductase
MGTMVAHAISETTDLAVVARIDPHDANAVASLEDLDPSQVDVVVDFSVAEVARTTMAWAAQHGIAAVVGTTGFSEDDYAAWSTSFASGHAIVAANFAIGAVLAQRWAREAALYFDRVEIIEYHHDQKADAPSGTALETARVLRDVRRHAGVEPIVEPTTREPVAHSRGADAGDNIRVHAVRMPGMTAHQDIMFGGPGEGLTIRHDAYDRTSFAAGVLLAIRKVRDVPGLTRGLAALL